MIVFNDIQIPKFIVVSEINNPILPPLTQNTVKINGRAGNVSFGNEVDSRNIKVEVTILADNKLDLKLRLRDFADWLYYDEPKKLIVDDDLGVYYMAQITESTDITEIYDNGQGTITFVCNDPHAYSIDEMKASLTGVETGNVTNKIINLGQLNAYPNMEFVFSEPTTTFNIITQNEVMTFGESNVDKVSKDINPLVFHDLMDSGTGWATANYVDDGIVTGNTFNSNGWSVRTDNYGEGTRWHGVAGVKSLGTQLQDFKLGCFVGMIPTAVGQLGRVQVYGLDINGNVIFTVSMRQGNPNKITPYAQVKIGNKFYIETYGDREGAFTPFRNGRMDIARRGNKWRIYYAVQDTNGKDHAQMTKEFTIGNGGYEVNKLAQIQIHFGAFGESETNPPVPEMWISDLKVWNESPTLSVSETPIIFKTGDRLTVDSSNDSIHLNGQPYYTSMSTSSQFPLLKRGTNDIMISPSVISSGTIKFRERFW